MKISNVIQIITATLLFLSSIAAAQNKIINQKSSETSSEVIAKVNGQVITRAEIENLLVDQSSLESPETQTSLKKRLLNERINHYLIKQEVEKNYNEFNAIDLTRLEFMKSQAEFNFYLNNIAGKIPKPSRREIEKHIEENPKYFSDRKVYHVVEYLIKANDDNTVELVKSAIEGDGNLSRISAVLNKNEILYTRSNKWLGADELSKEKLKFLERMTPKTIDFAIYKDQKIVVMTYLAGVYSDPIYMEDAVDLVEKRSMDVYAGKKIQQILNSLRAKADVNISDGFLNEISSSKDQKEANLNALRFEISIISWVISALNLSLLILVPYSVISLYMQSSKNKALEKVDPENHLVSAPHPLLIIKDLRIPYLLILPSILFLPLILFLNDLPVWMTGVRFASSLLMGTCIGVGFLVFINKIKPINYFFQNKWIYVLMIVLLDTGLIVVS